MYRGFQDWFLCHTCAENFDKLVSKQMQIQPFPWNRLCVSRPGGGSGGEGCSGADVPHFRLHWKQQWGFFKVHRSGKNPISVPCFWHILPFPLSSAAWVPAAAASATIPALPDWWGRGFQSHSCLLQSWTAAAATVGTFFHSTSPRMFPASPEARASKPTCHHPLLSLVQQLWSPSLMWNELGMLWFGRVAGRGLQSHCSWAQQGTPRRLCREKDSIHLLLFSPLSLAGSREERLWNIIHPIIGREQQQCRVGRGVNCPRSRPLCWE